MAQVFECAILKCIRIFFARIGIPSHISRHARRSTARDGLLCSRHFRRPRARQVQPRARGGTAVQLDVRGPRLSRLLRGIHGLCAAAASGHRLAIASINWIWGTVQAEDRFQSEATTAVPGVSDACFFASCSCAASSWHANAVNHPLYGCSGSLAPLRLRRRPLARVHLRQVRSLQPPSTGRVTQAD